MRLHNVNLNREGFAEYRFLGIADKEMKGLSTLALLTAYAEMLNADSICHVQTYNDINTSTMIKRGLESLVSLSLNIFNEAFIIDREVTSDEIEELTSKGVKVCLLKRNGFSGYLVNELDNGTIVNSELITYIPVEKGQSLIKKLHDYLVQHYPLPSSKTKNHIAHVVAGIHSVDDREYRNRPSADFMGKEFCMNKFGIRNFNFNDGFSMLPFDSFVDNLQFLYRFEEIDKYFDVLIEAMLNGTGLAEYNIVFNKNNRVIDRYTNYLKYAIHDQVRGDKRKNVLVTEEVKMEGANEFEIVDILIFNNKAESRVMEMAYERFCRTHRRKLVLIYRDSIRNGGAKIKFPVGIDRSEFMRKYKSMGSGS